MDAYELHQALLKHSTVEKPRPPLFPAEKNHGTTTTNQSRIKEVRSRYKSPTPSASPRRGRSPSPVATSTASSSISVPKRAVSAERRRPSTPPGSGPSTPVQHTNAETLLASRKVSGNRLPESLWPSTSRSLSVSFQSDASSKSEKTVNHVTSDRTLRPSSNVAHKHNESPPVSRKSTPERKRSPVIGKNLAEHTENSRPIESVHSRLVEQHRWPSRAGSKVSSSLLNRSIDLVDKGSKISPLPLPGKGDPTLRRFSLDGSSSNSLMKSSTDFASHITSDGKPMISRSVDDNSAVVDKRFSSRLFELAKTVSVRSQTLTTPGSHLASVSSVSRGVSPSSTKSGSFTTPSVSRGVSPSRTNPGSSITPSVSRGVSPSRTNPGSSTTPSISRGVSPTRTKPVSSTTPSVSRGVSPSRIKSVNSTTSSRGSSPARSTPSSPTKQTNATSVLSFMADIKKGMKDANHFDDVHQLRMLYNRQLQWQYANALADVSLHSQTENTERNMYSIWRATLDLQHSVIGKRMELNRMRLKSKLCLGFNGQLTCLDRWASIEKDHAETLAQAIKDLEASTLLVPLTSGARGDVQTFKAAMSSAIDIVEAMGSPICRLLSQAEDMNELVNEVARITAEERDMIYECEALMESTISMETEECSLRSHLIQLKEAWKREV